jgi:oligogalacturonide transporter
MKPADTRVVKPSTHLAYGATDMFGSGAMAVIGSWVLFFYTTFCGLTALEAASIFGIARILDAVSGTVIGHYSDIIGNTWVGRRFGRRRGFLLFAIPLMPCFALMWVSGQSFYYYLFTYLFFEVVYAAVLIPYETLAAEMTDDYRVRARLAGARILTGQAAAFLASILPAWITGGKDSATADTFLLMGGIFSGIFMVSILATYLFTWERDRPGTATPARAIGLGTLLRNVTSTMRIRAFRQHLGLYVGGFTANDVTSAVFTFFVVFVASGNITSASLLLGVMTAAQFASVVIFTWATNIIGPARAFRIAAFTSMAGLVAMAATVYVELPVSPLFALVPCVILAGLGRGGLVYIPWHTYNYIADVDEIVTTRRREGVFAGVMTMVRKAVGAAAVTLVGLLMQMAGFVPSAASQPESARTAILLALTVIPIASLLFGIFVSRRFILGPASHSVLMTEIARLRSGDLVPPSGEAGAVVEALTGQPNHTLWDGALTPPKSQP